MDDAQPPMGVVHMYRPNAGRRAAGRQRTILTLVDFDERSLVACKTAVRTADEAGSALFALHLSIGQAPLEALPERDWAGRVAEDIARMLFAVTQGPLKADVTIGVYRGSETNLLASLSGLVAPDVIMSGWPMSSWNPQGVLGSLCHGLCCPLLLLPSTAHQPSAGAGDEPGDRVRSRAC